MEWFKHSTRSHDDPDISDAIDEFGHPGYSIFFIVLEIYGDEYNHLDSEGWLRLSKRFVTRKLRLSSTKVEQILNFYSERERILFKKDDKSYFINCPKFIDIASNWTKRKNPSPTEALQSTFVAPTAIEVEEEVEVDKEVETTLIPPNGGIVPEGSGDAPTKQTIQCPHQDIITLYHEILPSLNPVKEWTEDRQKMLRTRWREKVERQSLEWWRYYFGWVSESDFLMGRSGDFMADLEWLIRPKNFVKVIEGRYHNRNGSNPLVSKSTQGILGWAARERARMAKEGQHDD